MREHAKKVKEARQHEMEFYDKMHVHKASPNIGRGQAMHP